MKDFWFKPWFSRAEVYGALVVAWVVMKLWNL